MESVPIALREAGWQALSAARSSPQDCPQPQSALDLEQSDHLDPEQPDEVQDLNPEDAALLGMTEADEAQGFDREEADRTDLTEADEGQDPDLEQADLMDQAEVDQRQDAEAEENQWQDADIVQGLQAFYLTVDQVIAGVTSCVELPCRAGCSHCCKDVPPPLSLSEWKVLVDHLYTMDPDLRTRVLLRAQDLYADHHELMERIEDEPENFDALSRAMGYACPFLVDEGCSVYPARPHACRLYGNSFIPSHGKMFACHLVEEALLGQEPPLVNFEGTVAMLRMYPDTLKSQVFPWFVAHHLPEELQP